MRKEKVMGQPVIELKHLTKTYGKHTVVSDFQLSVEKGRICGLIGPNGAGKTTIMKMMAGLVLPDSGQMQFLGESENIDRVRRKMSFMLEAPIVDPAMSARENMRYVKYVKGIADKKKIDQMLELVKLSDTGKKKAGKFSLGMKQRLGIAMAMLSEPEILVLDEPVNGLDPEGIVEIRLLLKKLSEEKDMTILISSHILSELSELCTDFILMNHGVLIEAVRAEELLAKSRHYIAVRTDNLDKTVEILKEKLAVSQYKVIHGEELHLFEYLDDIGKVSKTITDSGFVITKLVQEGETLEQYYLSKVGAADE